jgi:hypothetical protein
VIIGAKGGVKAGWKVVPSFYEEMFHGKLKAKQKRIEDHIASINQTHPEIQRTPFILTDKECEDFQHYLNELQARDDQDQAVVQTLARRFQTYQDYINKPCWVTDEENKGEKQVRMRDQPSEPILIKKRDGTDTEKAIIPEGYYARGLFFEKISYYHGWDKSGLIVVCDPAWSIDKIKASMDIIPTVPPEHRKFFEAVKTILQEAKRSKKVLQDAQVRLQQASTAAVNARVLVEESCQEQLTAASNAVKEAEAAATGGVLSMVMTLFGNGQSGNVSSSTTTATAEEALGARRPTYGNS